MTVIGSLLIEKKNSLDRFARVEGEESWFPKDGLQRRKS